jgi:hypothetical protein
MFKPSLALVWTLLGAAASIGQKTAGPGDSLVRAAITKQKERPMWFRLRSVGLDDMPFVYQYKARKMKFNGDGSVKDDAWWKEEVVRINDIPFVTPLESSFDKNPKIRTIIEEQHQKTFDEAQRKRRVMSEADIRKAQEAKKKRQDERRQFWEEFLAAFRFRQIEHLDHQARPTTKFAFAPEPAYRTHGCHRHGILPQDPGTTLDR